MSEYFPKGNSLGEKLKFGLDLCNYATKEDLKKCNRCSYIKNLQKKVHLASLKSEFDKLDIDKLGKVPTGSRNLKGNLDKLDVDKLVLLPVNSSKVSDIVKNDAVKKIEYWIKEMIEDWIINEKN